MTAPQPAAIRTFKLRRGRISGRHEHALATLTGDYGVPGPEAAADPVALFGRDAPLVLEIGSGMGEATAAMAAADPGRDYLATEVHVAGAASLLALAAERGLDNVRVAGCDAAELVPHLAPGSLAAVHVFFPDPWPKARHHKRRLIRPAMVALLRSRLRQGGILHCATDWPPYAEVMLAVLGADPELANTAQGYSGRPEHRPVTKFEQRGIEAGRPIRDLVFARTSG
jgi:tRNA (guanine-N7-)-methyltransferase